VGAQIETCDRVTSGRLLLGRLDSRRSFAILSLTELQEQGLDSLAQELVARLGDDQDLALRAWICRALL